VAVHPDPTMALVLRLELFHHQVLTLLGPSTKNSTNPPKVSVRKVGYASAWAIRRCRRQNRQASPCEMRKRPKRYSSPTTPAHNRTSWRRTSWRTLFMGAAVLAVAVGSSIPLARSLPRMVPLYAYHGHERGIIAIAWSPDGRYSASGGPDHIVQVWRPSSDGG